jgi:hypothetical protein
MHSSIGKIIIGSDGKPIINVSAVVQAMKAQLSIEAQYRQIFGCDLGTRPGPVMLEDQVLMLAKIQAVQEYRATLASLQMVPLPPGYATMTPQQQMRAGLDGHRAAKAEQDAAIAALPPADDDVVDAEIVDDDD